ncbi:hypothetical protein C8F04DRAFT_1276775 [Mycena alexandri]|uniref:Uncharacterized protein n=1 Tax=Mycena alexandri TaxID=1745969 RepID=A0AAD6S0Z9_9AGAR|nr:hypothetical protein C8F04DRAFT_1276775 [Mycena alexandri]
MTWAKKAVTDILHAHGTRYFESKGDDRDNAVTSIVDALRAAQIDDLPDRLDAKVKVWYNNNSSLFRKETGTKEVHSKMKIKRWDAKLVAREVHEDRYEVIKTEIRDAGTEWHDIYRQTIARLWNELSAQEQKACQDISNSRNHGELKEEEKRKLARANGNREVAAFIKKMQEVYGIRMLCLASFTDPDGKAQTSVHETLSISPKFSQQFPKWKTMKGIANAFLEYSELFEDSNAGDDDSDDEDQASSTKKSKYPWAVVGKVPDDDLPENMEEYPLLPEVPKETGQEWIGGGKMVIRAFVKAVYRVETGSSMPPWSAMATPDGARELVHSKYLPAGIALKDPSRMVKSEVEALYKLWISRQKEKKIPLHFKVAEAKRKIAEDQRVRIQSLKRKQPAYIETDDEEEQEKEKHRAEGGGKKNKKAKMQAQSTSGEQPVKKPNGKRGQSTGGATSVPAKSQPRPRPVPSAEMREEKLLHLSKFGPYTSLVFDLLKLSPRKADATETTAKALRPAWSTWEIKDVQIGADFFDQNNQTGYLPNWQAVVAWMESNPHIPTDGAPLSHAQASDILLIIGITHYAGKQVAEAERDSPFYNFPFEMSDLEKVEGAIKSMLAQTKKLFKFGVSLHRSIDNNWKKVCLEVGLAETDVSTFGEDWRVFVEAYAALDCALIRSGKASQLLASELFPEVLQDWSRQLDVDGNLPIGDDTDWEKAMGTIAEMIAAGITSAQKAKDLDRILEETWSRRGKGGLVCVVLGMKWWRVSLIGSNNEDQLVVWTARVRELTASLKTLTKAKSITRPESRRGGP